MISTDAFLRESFDSFERRGVKVRSAALTDDFEVTRVVAGRPWRTVLDVDILLASGASHREFSAAVLKLIDDFVAATDWQTDRPRGVMAGHCGAFRFFGRRCAV